MINLYEQTPSVYHNQSRDFQLLEHLYELVLNYAKTNTDLVQTVPIVSAESNSLLELLALTVGFRPRHLYNNDQLAALLSTFMLILRQKGSITAIESLCTALINAEHIKGNAYVEPADPETEEVGTIKIFIPFEFQDLGLLKDALDYVLPAGMTYNIYKADRKNAISYTTVGIHNTATSYETPSSSVSIIPEINSHLVEQPLGDTAGLIPSATIVTKITPVNTSNTTEENTEN